MHSREPEEVATTPQNAYRNLLDRLASLDDIVYSIASIEPFDKRHFQRFMKAWEDEVSVLLVNARAKKPALTVNQEADLRYRAEIDVARKFDFLAVMLNPDEFNVDVHFHGKGNRERFYSYLSSCFSPEILQDYGITKESCVNAKDVDMIIKFIVITCVCKELEANYFEKFNSEYQENIAPHLDNPALNKSQLEKILDMAKVPAFPLSKQGRQFDNKFPEFMQLVTESVQLKKAIMGCKATIEATKVFLPVHIKNMNEVLSILHGRLDAISAAQRLHIVNVLHDYCRKPGEDNRKALIKLSEMLADQFPGVTKLEAISGNLHTLAITTPKSALQASSMYSPSKKTDDFEPPKPNFK